MATPLPISDSALGASRADLARVPSNAGLASEQDRFASVLNRAQKKTETPEEAARSAAEQLVAITLVQPVLAQLRSTNQAAPPFAPTQAEKQFGALMDAQFAQDIVRSSSFPLVDRLARGMLERLAPRPDQAESEQTGMETGSQGGLDEEAATQEAR